MHVTAIPLVLKPRILSAKNRIKSARADFTNWVRAAVLISFSIVLVAVLYYGTLETLNKITALKHIVYVAPSLPLGLVLIMLFAMLFFSNLVTALGALFLSHDLDLLLASPITYRRFFVAKLIEVIMSSSWMTVVFGMPVVAGFAVFYDAGAEFFLITAAAIVPYFIIPSAVAMFLVTLFATVIPANRTREIMLVICAVALAGIYFIVRILVQGGSAANFNDLFKVLGLLNLPNKSWLPSYWVAHALSEALLPSGRGALPYLAVLWTVASTAVTLTFITLTILHHRAYSRARSAGHGLKLHSAHSQRLLSLLLPGVPQPYRAFVAKEFKTFARDMGQAVQLLMLLGLCMIYLYNFNIMQSFQGLSPGALQWWKAFLIISNLCLGAFVVTAVGTRFVFPSISLEGQAFWILQSGPLTMRQLLRAKFACWFLPVATIAAVVFASGAFAINAEPEMVLFNVIAAAIFCYGIVGIAVGLGAFFANFTWEHASQLAASFGSLVYMLVTSALIGVNMLPIGVLMMLKTFKAFHFNLTPLEWYTAVVSSLLLMMYLNMAAARWAFNLGENALLMRQR